MTIIVESFVLGLRMGYSLEQETSLPPLSVLGWAGLQSAACNAEMPLE